MMAYGLHVSSEVNGGVHNSVRHMFTRLIRSDYADTDMCNAFTCIADSRIQEVEVDVWDDMVGVSVPIAPHTLPYTISRPSPLLDILTNSSS